MTSTKLTSTGHALSDSAWLDTHFQSARAEYEDSLRYVGVQLGWRVLDAGCGGGGFLPLMSELVGPQGTVVALDLAPENVAGVEALVRDGQLPANVQGRIGSLLSLPFEDATFDCIWSANVMQYLTEAEFDCVIAEFKRVLKPGATLAIKDFDTTLAHIIPMDAGVVARFFSARRAKYSEGGVLGISCGTSMASRLRRAGLTDIRRKSWLVERWAPVAPATRKFAQSALLLWAGDAQKYDIPISDKQLWREAAANPSGLLDDPDFCFREGFVVAVGRVAT